MTDVGETEQTERLVELAAQRDAVSVHTLFAIHRAYLHRVIDLRRFLDQRPIRARRAGWVDRLAKWSQRNVATSRAIVAARFFPMEKPLQLPKVIWEQNPMNGLATMSCAPGICNRVNCGEQCSGTGT